MPVTQLPAISSRFMLDAGQQKLPGFDTTSAVFEADSSLLYNLEASWRKGPFWLAGEYVFNDVDGPALDSPDLGGYHVTASWALTGEMRGYNRKGGILQRLPIARSVYQGGWGAWGTSARWSDLDLSDGMVQGGEMRIFSLGLNWWLSPFMNLNWNYRWITLDRFDLNGDSRGFMGRITLLLE